MSRAKTISDFLGLTKSTTGLLLMVVLVAMGERMAERFLPIYLLALGGGVISIGLVPIMRPLNDVCCRTTTPVAATVCNKELAEFVEVESPLIAAAVGKHFELVTNGMISPDSRAQFDALPVGRSRFANS